MENYLINRRKFLIGAGAFGLSSMLPFNMSFAAAPTEKRLLVVILRGAMDGLAAVVPFKDARYMDIRGDLAMPQSDDALINLDGYFALHTALKPFSELYNNKELVILHAAATPYRDRSHFDAQDLLENGSTKPHGLNTGWLNRAVEAMNNGTKSIAIGPAIPLLLKGNADVNSWAPSTLPSMDEDFLTRVMHMYENDEMLSKALKESEEMKDISSGSDKGIKGQKAFIPMMKRCAEFLSQPNGARIASIDLGGWDTHASQGLEKGRMATALTLLSDGVAEFKNTIGDNWKNTAILVITEFGRTVRANGTGGSDHGTGSASFLIGGKVNGGRVIGDWPTLAKLYEDRDLYPANDLRSLIKSTLNQHLGLSTEVISTKILPESAAVPIYTKLFKA